MARFTGGWVKLHREVLEKDIVQNIYLWALWNYLLSIAVYKDSQIICNGKQRILSPGQLAFSPRQLADMWGINHMTIWKWLKYLVSTNRIVYETYTRGTIVTICNWREYQVEEELTYTPAIREVDAKYTPAIREVALNEEGKKERREEGKKAITVGIRLDYPPEFDAIWKAYGRKGEKKASYLEYQKLKLSDQEIQDLGKAITNYQYANPEIRYRKDMERFLKSDWREWVNWVSAASVTGNGFHPVTKTQAIHQANDELIKRRLEAMGVIKNDPTS